MAYKYKAIKMPDKNVMKVFSPMRQRWRGSKSVWPENSNCLLWLGQSTVGSSSVVQFVQDKRCSLLFSSERHCHPNNESPFIFLSSFVFSGLKTLIHFSLFFPPLPVPLSFLLLVCQGRVEGGGGRHERKTGEALGSNLPSLLNEIVETLKPQVLPETHHENRVLFLHLQHFWSSSSSHSSWIASPESLDDGWAWPGRLAGGGGPPSDGLRGDEARERSRSSRETELEGGRELCGEVRQEDMRQTRRQMMKGKNKEGKQ